MEEYTLGRLLKGIREDYQITREELGAGIVSGNVLLDIEQGEQYADKMTIDFLLARGGLSSLFYECYIDDDELESFDRRMELRRLSNDILRVLYIGQDRRKVLHLLAQGRQMLSHYRKRWGKRASKFVLNGPIHCFFCGIMEAYFLMAEDAVMPEAYFAGKRQKQIWETWGCLRGESYQDLMEKRWPYLSAMELECLMLAACAYEADGMRSEAKALLYRILEYNDHHEQELEELVKVYPYATRYLAELEERDGNRKKAFAICAQAMELLMDANSLKGEIALMDFMIEHWCEDGGYAMDRKALLAQRDCLLELYQEYGENSYGVYPMMTMENAILASEAVKRGRVSLGMTQKQLSEGIVEPETLSRFERGKLKLRWKTVKKLLEKLGMRSQKAWLLIESDRPKTIMRYWKIGTYVGAWQTGAAVEQLRCLRRELDMRSAVNCQLIGYYELTMQKQRYQIKMDEDIEKKYEELLELSLPGYPVVDWNCVFITQNEATLFNAIALNLQDRGKEMQSVKIYKLCIDNLENRRVNMMYPKQYMQFIESNLACELGNIQREEEAISISEQLLKNELYHGCGKGMAEALYEIAWNLRELERKKKINERHSCIFFIRSWKKALLEGNREFILFLEERKMEYGYMD